MTAKTNTEPGPRRILFVLDNFYPFTGGAETLFWELSRTLSAQGACVEVVTTWQPGTETTETVDGVEIHRVKTPRWCSRYLFILLAIPAVLRLARRADVIHASVYASAFPAWVCGVIRRKPTVLTVYEVFGDQWHRLTSVGRLAGWAFRAYEWVVLHLPFDHIVCISRFTQRRFNRFTKVPIKRTSVVYPAVDYTFWNRDRHQPADLHAQLGLDGGTFVYLYYGRPGPSKGVDDLIASARRVREAISSSHLVLLLGKEPADGRQRILRQIRELGLEDDVTVLDPVPRPELPRYLLAADCVVVPSVSEGFGYSAVEAATLGCRVVATAGHATEEVLDGYVALVPPKDPGALARAVVDLAGQRPTRREAPRRYTIQSHVAGILDVYERVTRPDLGVALRQGAAEVRPGGEPTGNGEFRGDEALTTGRLRGGLG